MAGYVAFNKQQGITKTVSYQHALMLLNDPNVVFVDVRSFFEKEAQGSLPNAMNVDLDQLPQRYSSIPKDKKIIVFCDNGIRGYNAELFLRNQGYDVYNLDGGYHYISNMIKENTNV